MPPRQDRLVSLTTCGIYGGGLKDAIFALKYQHRQAIAPTLAALLLPHVAPLVHAGDILVPVPLHPARLRERGYNQATVLASALADAFALAGLPRVHVREDLLQRIRVTADQTRLGPEERQRNVAGAFHAGLAVAALPVAGRLWLVDDVLTTGATMRACATALTSMPSSVGVHGLAVARATGAARRRTIR